jgi:hypothetical protein
MLLGEHEMSDLSVTTGGDFEPLICRAQREKLFFYSREKFFDLWMSPEEFKQKLQKGCRWLNREWVLVDPQVRVMQIERSIFLLREELNDLRSEMNRMKFSVKNVAV